MPVPMASRKTAQKITGRLAGEIDSVNIMNTDVKSFSQYDKVILGGSIYMGQLQKN